MGLFLPILLLLLLAAVFLAGMGSHAGVLLAAVWFLLGIYAGTRLWARRAAGRLRAERTFTDHAFWGDEVQVGLTVRNTGALPAIWLELSESVPLALQVGDPPSAACSLGGYAARTFRYTLACRRRGRYTIGPVRAETGDLLGLEQLVRVLSDPAGRTDGILTVYPRIVPLTQLGLPTHSALTVLRARLPLFEDPTRVRGVRDYQPGDSLRRIHWSASAHAGALLVKQFQPAITRESLICLDFDRRRYDRWDRDEAMEQAIVCAASLTRHMIEREGVPAGLAVEAIDSLDGEHRRIVLPPHTGQGQLVGLLEVLARIEASPRGDFPALLHAAAVQLPWGSTVLAVTGVLDDALSATLTALKRRGHAVAVMLVRPGGGGPAAIAGIPVWTVWSDRDLVVTV